MCDFFGGGKSPSHSTTPAYVPPAQVATSGPASSTAPGVRVKGETGSAVSSTRARGRRSVQGDDTTLSPRRRRATASLGL